MYTFKDLVFKPHHMPALFDGQARLQLTPSSYISVVYGEGAYGSCVNGVQQYELMDLEGEVTGFLTEQQVTDKMIQIQQQLIEKDNINMTVEYGKKRG